MAEKQLIEDRWSNVDAAGLAGLDLLIYLSRLVGADPGLVLWGGGNTSLKLTETDFRGRPTEVMRVKGSGSDLKSVTARDFPGVRIDDVIPLLERDEPLSDEQMVSYLAHTLMEPGGSRPSIETLLHGFVPYRCVVHSHADAILAVTNNERQGAILSELYGDELAIIPYHRPGFHLSRLVGQAVRTRPTIKGVVLLNHGLITWHDDPREAYRLHIEMVDRAARYTAVLPVGEPAKPRPAHALSDDKRAVVAARLAPLLRGLLTRAGDGQGLVMQFDDQSAVLDFVSGRTINPERLAAVLQQGAATPDHILNTKRRAMWLATDDLSDHATLLTAAQQAYTTYHKQYQLDYEAHHTNEALLAPIPRVVLVRGVGMFSVGKDTRAATVAGDIYRHTIAIVTAAEQVGGYRSLNDADAFAAEYWPLELYKLTLAPNEAELSRKVVLITGAAGAIGTGIAHRLAAAGAHVVCADLDLAKASVLVAEINAGKPNRSLAVAMDVSNEASVQAAYQKVVLTYGGLDVLVSNAGFAHNGPLDELSLADWQRSFAVNATGHFLVAREAMRLMKAQGSGGSLIFIATKNVPAPGKDFGAYSAAKAAEVQLARVLAIEGGPFGIRSNIINPDAIFAGSGLWSEAVRTERAKSYGIAADQPEAFYQARNLLKVEVTADDVAEATLFYAGNRAAKTTGSMLPVDGGLREAFPR